MDEYKQGFFILNASSEVTVFSLIFKYKHGFKNLLSELVDRGRVDFCEWFEINSTFFISFSQKGNNNTWDLSPSP